MCDEPTDEEDSSASHHENNEDRTEPKLTTKVTQAGETPLALGIQGNHLIDTVRMRRGQQ